MKRIKIKLNSFVFSSEKGLTLVEILASITILSILVVSFLSMFVQSSRTNKYSEDIVDSTYLAESNTEMIYKLVSTSTSMDSLTDPMANNGFNKITTGCSSGTCYEKNSNGRYIYVQLANTDSTNTLVNTKVKVYEDRSKTKQEAQMEILLSWKK